MAFVGLLLLQKNWWEKIFDFDCYFISGLSF